MDSNHPYEEYLLHVPYKGVLSLPFPTMCKAGLLQLTFTLTDITVPYVVAEGGIEPLTHFKGYELMRLVRTPVLVTTANCLFTIIYVN